MDIALADQRGQAVQVAARRQRAAGIVRRVEEDQPGTRGDRIGQALPVHGEIRQGQRHVHAATARQLHGGLIAVIAGIEDDGLVARTDQRLHRAEDRLGGTGGDGDLAVGVPLHAVVACNLRCHLLAQGGQTGHRRILIAPFQDMARHCFTQRLRPVEIGKALGQVDRPGIQSELRHAREDGGADVGQFAGEHRDFLGESCKLQASGRKQKRLGSSCSLRLAAYDYRLLSLRFFSAFLWWLIRRRFLFTWRSVSLFLLPSYGLSPPLYSIRIGVPTSLSTRRKVFSR